MRYLVVGLMAVGCGGEVTTLEVGSSAQALTVPLGQVATFGEVTHAGTGCRANDSSAELVGGEVRVELDAFEVGPGQRYRACNVGVPFEVDAGYQVGLAGIGVVGTASGNPAARLRVAKFFSGAPEVALELPWPPSGPVDPGGFATAWSECGGSGIARWSVSLRALQNGSASLISARGNLVARACQ